MTPLDRILCVFGFHETSEVVKVIKIYENETSNPDFPIANKVVFTCKVCGRYHNKTIRG